MKLLPLLLLLGILPLRADILVNGNFADGHAHWKGDIQDTDAGDSASLSGANSGAAAGVTINLKKDKWTKIYQSFTARNEKLFTITFQLSADYKLSSRNADDTSSADFSDVPGIYMMWSMSERFWNLLVSGGSFANKILEPDTKKMGQQQTLTGRVSDLNTDTDSVFLLAFPPGEGSVTLFNIALSPNDPNADPNAGP